jgi:hypothetical protein
MVAEDNLEWPYFIKINLFTLISRVNHKQDSQRQPTGKSRDEDIHKIRHYHINFKCKWHKIMQMTAEDNLEWPYFIKNLPFYINLKGKSSKNKVKVGPPENQVIEIIIKFDLIISNLKIKDVKIR